MNLEPPSLNFFKFSFQLIFSIAPLLLIGACAPEPIELGQANYQLDAVLNYCANNSRPGRGGIIDGESTLNGIKFNVRTPLNYNATNAHPLLVVYAPARRSRMSTERLTKLTFDATRAGFIVAYADHRALSKSAIVELGSIPKLIAEKWCIDEERVYLSGHSDGGSVAMGLAFMEETKHIPSAVAPSAAGIKHSDFALYSCPKPISVMVMHSEKDTHFPGFGKQAADWWAACNGCDSVPSQQIDDSCNAYPNCTNQVATWYCEGANSHADWPQINASMIQFFTSQAALVPTQFAVE